MSHTTKASAAFSFVLAGRGPAIHGSHAPTMDVDARNESGHDASKYSVTEGEQRGIRP